MSTERSRSPYPAPRRGMIYMDAAGDRWKVLTVWRHPHGSNQAHTVLARNLETGEERTVSVMDWRAGWREVRG